MNKKPYNRILAGLKEALEIAQGKKEPARIYVNGKLVRKKPKLYVVK